MTEFRQRCIRKATSIPPEEVERLQRDKEREKAKEQAKEMRHLKRELAAKEAQLQQAKLPARQSPGRPRMDGSSNVAGTGVNQYSAAGSALPPSSPPMKESLVTDTAALFAQEALLSTKAAKGKSGE